jgi:hypothetical protein
MDEDARIVEGSRRCVPLVVLFLDHGRVRTKMLQVTASVRRGRSHQFAAGFGRIIGSDDAPEQGREKGPEIGGSYSLSRRRRLILGHGRRGTPTRNSEAAWRLFGSRSQGEWRGQEGGLNRKRRCSETGNISPELKRAKIRKMLLAIGHQCSLHLKNN